MGPIKENGMFVVQDFMFCIYVDLVQAPKGKPPKNPIRLQIARESRNHRVRSQSWGSRFQRLEIPFHFPRK
jgi:hypothetical protein